MNTRILLVVAGIAVAGAAIWHPAAPPAVVETPAASASPAHPGGAHRRPAAVAAQALVYVTGAVAKPGLYRVGRDARVVDAVRAAGGLSSAADATAIDLAAFARDGDEILVPAAGQAAAKPVRRRRLTRGRRTTALPLALDVNAASQAELSSVPGIGGAIAARVVALRDRDGAFSSLDELLDVAGMTQTRLERARPYLRPP